MTDIRKPQGYKALTIAGAGTLVLFPIIDMLPYVELLIGLALVVVLLLAVRAVAERRVQIVVSSAIGVFTVIGYFGNFFGFGNTFAVIGTLGFSLFFLYVAIVIMANIMRHIRRVTEDMIYGAINVYLLVGLSFSFSHALVHLLRPESISGLEALSMGEGSIMPFVYYSFVTMTTLGYGDVSPVTPVAGSLAYLQAVFGQLYIAILIARLVGLYVAQETAPDPGGASATEETRA